MRDTYEAFVRARHEAWKNRVAGKAAPWTADPVVQNNKFTNVFRVLDRGTQYVVKNLLYGDDCSPQDALMRCFLYRYTNRPEPWQHFRSVVGRHPVCGDLGGLLDDVWEGYKAAGNPIFGNAYKMFVGAENAGTDRLTWVLTLTRDWFAPGQPFATQFFQKSTQEAKINHLKIIPRCADFMGMQILTDIGYSKWAPSMESEFIVPGPGAIVGARHIAPGQSPLKLIYDLTEFWSGEDVELQGRTPSLMDVQNTLCEFGKYVRWSSSDTSSRKPYTGMGRLQKPFLPPHWKGTE